MGQNSAHRRPACWRGAEDSLARADPPKQCGEEDGSKTGPQRGRRASSLLKPKGTDAAVRRDSAGEWSRRDRIIPPLILSATERRTSLFQMRVFIRSLRRKICTQTELPHPARAVRDLKEIFGT